MEKFLFSDGQDVCLYDNGNIIKQHSKYIENYKNACLNVERNKNWKHSGEGAQFRGDVRRDPDEGNFKVALNVVYLS